LPPTLVFTIVFSADTANDVNEGNVAKNYLIDAGATLYDAHEDKPLTHVFMLRLDYKDTARFRAKANETVRLL
jgi:hypothetical protein